MTEWVAALGYLSLAATVGFSLGILVGVFLRIYSTQDCEETSAIGFKHDA